jgi:hypothetical protein
MVRKIVQELNEFDNVYYEICNEPYWMKGIPRIEPSITEQQFLPEIDEWQNLILREIVETERQLPHQHMIAQNIANTYLEVEDLKPGVSMLNFHYAFPPKCVRDNYQWNLPIAFDETADGCNAPDRRREAWAFIMAGGAVYSNLDWSFATDDLTGLGRNPSGKRQSGKEVREQLKVLKATIQSFNYIHSRPIDDTFRTNIPEGVSVYGLMREGEDYLLYLLKRQKKDFRTFQITLPSGSFEVQMIDPLDGNKIVNLRINHTGGDLLLALPPFLDDLCIRIIRV